MQASEKTDAKHTHTEVRMSLVEALDKAQSFQRTEDLEAAESIYGEILEQLPDEPNATIFLGILRHQQGRSEDGVVLLRRATELVPDEAGVWLNLGNVLIELERFDQAAEALRRSLELKPESAAVFNNLGIAHLRCGKLDDSEEAFLKGLELEPDRADVHFNYARMLNAAGRHRESIAHSIQALENDPTQASSRQLLCMSYSVLGEREKAIESLLEWRALEPDNPQVDHLMAAVGGTETPQRAADNYVKHVFDGFASTFDHKLGLLEYKAPQLVTEALLAVRHLLPEAPHIVDAGCGTGLCGPLLKPHVGRLVGVDLSQGMLDLALVRKVYDELEQAELTAFLEKSPASFDVIVSADTLCYFGDLNGFLDAARRALRPPGVAIFSLEASADETADFQLHVHGRYSHAKPYVLRTLDAQGFDVRAIDAQVLRREMNEPVHGWVVTAVRRADAVRT